MRIRERFVRQIIDIYRRSRLHGWWHQRGHPCRFVPSCSEYLIRVVTRDGFARGLVRGGRRLLRCGPWHDGSSIDFPPIAEWSGPVWQLDGLRLLRAPDCARLRLYTAADWSRYIEFPKDRTIDAWETHPGAVVVRVMAGSELVQGRM